ncbi:eIF-2-alpha kinase GCN2-like [Nilaparvata lugens]|uniref:eIF-2-alpha kinase GCN2-like n=1 Tax=Nilaparvata lugens TaxID=108931 RepID=UPI00193DC88E|nr:eIF-2-alpha kinase GCN2-like [Nilaparvata lugens]
MLPKKELTLDWSVGNEGVANASSDDDSSDDECWITFMPGVDDSSSSIAEESKSSDKEEQPSNGDGGRETANEREREQTDETTTTTNVTPLHFMYIQMEFCEKSTLRNAIDEGLYLEEPRVWRLLREIVEGLSHIHGQGIIHRDLKPVNIFIDCDDHVKIGDFGLATSNILHSALKPGGEQGGLLVGLATKSPAVSSSAHAQMGTALTSHTGQVGTALYVAPELNTFGVKASYDQKVDIYSLGVIFFEMCYHPVSTAMERLKILTDLRQPDCIFPSDFLEDKKPEQAHVVRWLLNHDACRRPSSQELLQSPLIPPPQLEDAQLQEMVRHTLSNPQSRAYKHLIAACFSQELSPAQDVTFDMSPSVRGASHAAQIELVAENVRTVLKQHGAVHLPMPLLTPAASHAATGVVRLMSRWGGVLAAPYDLRQAFARHLAQNAFVARLKRYAIDRVYRERRVLGFHPRELYECAFDIVTPSSAPATLAAAEAELLFAARQIVGTRSGSCFIRLNHMCLVTAVLLHCGIDYSSHERVCSLLAKTKLQEGGNNSRASAESALIGSDLAEQTVAMLISLLTKEDSYERLSAWLRPLVQKKAKSVCQQGLLHLKQLIEYIGLLGVEWSVVVSLGLIHELRDYSGVVFQVVWDQRGKQGRTERCVIAAGGRYDSMIHRLRHSLQLGVPPSGTEQHAAGISLSLDKLVAVMTSSGQGDQCGHTHRQTVAVVVCAVGNTGESCASGSTCSESCGRLGSAVLPSMKLRTTTMTCRACAWRWEPHLWFT